MRNLRKCPEINKNVILHIIKERYKSQIIQHQTVFDQFKSNFKFIVKSNTRNLKVLLGNQYNSFCTLRGIALK